MARKKNEMWIDPNGPGLAFLPNRKPARLPDPAQAREQRLKRKTAEQREEDRLQRVRRRELDELSHYIEVAKNRSAKAAWERKSRDIDRDLNPPAPPPTPAEEARRKRREMIDLQFEEREEKADAAQKAISHVRRKVISIHQDPCMPAGERYIRIRTLLENYGYDERILPPAIREFMENEAFKEDSFEEES